MNASDRGVSWVDQDATVRRVLHRKPWYMSRHRAQWHALPPTGLGAALHADSDDEDVRSVHAANPILLNSPSIALVPAAASLVATIPRSLQLSRGGCIGTDDVITNGIHRPKQKRRGYPTQITCE